MQNEEILSTIPIGDEENCAYEAYEGLNFIKKIIIIGFYFLCSILLYSITMLIPPTKIIQEKKLISNNTNLILNFTYLEKFIYLPFVSFSIENRNDYFTVVNMKINKISPNCSLNNNKLIKIKYKFNTILNLFPKMRKKLVTYKNINARNINLVFMANVVEGSFNNLYLIWKHFNTNIIPFFIIINLITSIYLYRLSIKLDQSFSLLKSKIPTASDKHLFYMLRFISFLLLPIPEFFFFEFFSFSFHITIIFQIIYKAVFLTLFDFHLMKLKNRKDTGESLINYQSISLFILLIIAFYFSESVTNNLFMLKISYTSLIALIIREFYLSFSMFNQKNLFSTSILFLFLILPCIIMCIRSIFLKAARFTKFELFIKILMTLSYSFITFLRWPFDDITINNDDDFNNDNNNIKSKDKVVDFIESERDTVTY